MKKVSGVSVPIVDMMKPRMKEAGAYMVTEMLSVTEKIRLGTTEIAKRIRKQLKEEFPDVEFSVTKESYSGGSSITIALMKASFKIVRSMNEIEEMDIFDMGSGYKKEDIEHKQSENYHQLNQYTLREVFNSHKWCNGVFITEKAHHVLQRAVQISDQYNFDKSDHMTDYFFVNYYLHMAIGKWNKPFVQGE